MKAILQGGLLALAIMALAIPVTRTALREARPAGGGSVGGGCGGFPGKGIGGTPGIGSRGGSAGGLGIGAWIITPH